jgi:RNA polymerase sigma-70 factor (ECF subfamily)
VTATRARPLIETDEELMGRVAEGDIRAFEALYDRHHVRAYSLARRVAGAGGGAEEATQDAFLALWRSASRFDPERGRMAPWLFAFVRHRSIDALRAAKARPTHHDLPYAAERLEAPERTEEQVLSMEESARARRLVAELPHEQREVIDLAYFAGYSQTEIAARVGVPLGTVKGRARLALDKLRDATERESTPPPSRSRPARHPHPAA